MNKNYVNLENNKIIKDDEFILVSITPGVDCSKQMNFSWHTFVSGSKFFYYKENNGMNDLKEIIPEERLWSIKGQKDVPVETEFYSERFIANVSLEGLDANTKYCFFITNENYKSKIYSFVTSGKNDSFEFLGLVDLQHGCNMNTKILINKLSNEFPQANLVICSGDLSGCSSYQKEYEWILKDLLDQYTFACAPGDHEYWANSICSPYPMYPTPYTYNAVFNNPKNGCKESINSNYYFYYNNVLFLAIDTLDSNKVTGDKMDAQLEWFKETMKELEGTYQYSVLIAHKSFYGSKEEDRCVRNNLAPRWHKVIDEFNIDLVLGGHDHMYSRTYQIYNDQVSDDFHKGTYYLDLGSSGNKYRLPGSDLASDGLHEKVLNLKELQYGVGARIKVNKECMDVLVINMNGVEIDHFTIKSKR